MDGGRDADEEKSKALSPSPPSASQRALTSCGSAAPQRHELTSKVLL